MLQLFRSLRPSLVVMIPALLFLAGCDDANAEPEGARQAANKTPPPPRVEPARPGDPFPAASYRTLNPAGTAPPVVDLSQILGHKPLLLYYWIPGHTRAEETFLELEKLHGELKPGSLALCGVAVPRPGIEAEAITARIGELGIKAPVLLDEGFRIGTQLSVRSVPNITLVDGQGVLRMTNAASLLQELEYKMTVATAIRRVADSGSLVTYGFLDPYFPVKELEGRPCPDFRAPLLTDSVEQRYHNLLDRDKLNVLIFWSVECPHCRKSLPVINEWLREHPGEVNVITAANVASEAAKLKTRDFCQANDFQFRTLIDRDARIGELYQVTSTPTILIIGPDGVVDSAITSTHTDFGATIREKQRKLVPSLQGS